ncbi:hypothetical protein FB45DRAFT_132469 [Roridomyces roridus]|uniref:Uncharacterized protein n=1 Tax=Roridomyces roridus TaxID=1738132 RepID=A0AAD7BH06_9AGAR|nr:hypothetical protein FB45DRAFT_132469 [Roridomyces roridus]
MPSFSQIAFIATAALAGFASAAPVAAPKRDLPSLPISTLPSILGDLSSKLGPVTSLLSSINLDNATAEVVTPITDELQSIMQGAVTELTALVGTPVSDILSTAEGAISTSDAAQLLANPLNTVSQAVADLVTAVQGSPAGAIINPLMADVTGVVNQVLAATGPLVPGLLPLVAPLTQGAFGLLDNLGMSPVVGVVAQLLG